MQQASSGSEGLPGGRALRVGLYGGSFDPVHLGHLHVAREARAAFGLDLVVFMPAAQPPHKPGRRLAPGPDRLRMLRLAVGGEPGFLVSDFELERGGLSYTIDTVRALPGLLALATAPAIHLILGSDNLPGLPLWREVEALLDAVTPIVLFRPGEPQSRIEELRGALPDRQLESLGTGFLAPPPVPISSTEIRKALARGNFPKDEVPPAVYEYLRTRDLYRT